MSNIVSAAQSSVGKKIVTGVTGVALVGFVVVHLAGNMTLFLNDNGRALNEYAHFLETLGHGALLPIAEVGLVVLFLAHIVSTIAVTARNRSARPVAYYAQADAGHTSRKTPSSKTMIYTGTLLLAFTVLHVLQFRVANLSNPYYFPTGDVRDLYRLVYEVFRSPFWVAVYVAAMTMLGLHLRHGFWSAFQSLGLNNRRLQSIMFSAAVLVAIVLAVGFLSIPIYVHFNAPPPGMPVPQAMVGGHS